MGEKMEREPSQLSRRNFLRMLGYSILGLGIDSLLSGCRPQAIFPLPTLRPAATNSPAPTFIPTHDNAPSQFSSGHLYHDPATREVLRSRLIAKYGPADRALSLEFHGDYYYLMSGSYSMDPETFTWLMEWFQEHEVWSVNGAELIEFLEGTIQLPARSVVLTTDSGNSSVESLTRMVPVLQRTGMHFISLILTAKMNPEESIACQEDVCWETFREASKSGVFTFGSHSERHHDFSDLEAKHGLKDILHSKDEIEQNLGTAVELLSWPYESCPGWMDQLGEYGFKAAFGGRSRAIEDCSIYSQDELRWCLPRLLPPNRDTLTSNRPLGMTIDQMMRAYSGGFED